MTRDGDVDKKLLARYTLREITGLPVMAAALFLSAGRLDWPQSWEVLAIMLAWIVATLWILLRLHPDLIAERLGPRKGSKPWDVAIMSAIGLLQLARYLLAGLDWRYGWSGQFALSYQIPAFFVCAGDMPW